MIKRIHSSLVLFLLIGQLAAQISVSGLVSAGELQDTPVPDWPVQLFFGAEELGTTVTSADGVFDLLIDEIPNEDEVWTVRTPDICTGGFNEVEIIVAPEAGDYSVILSICGDVNPPPPGEECHAAFTSDPTDSPTTYTFTNLSASTLPIDSLNWDFGTGDSSDEENPEYDFGSGGTYTVTLTIFSGDCTSSISQIVFVFDPANCDCEESEDDLPVCVIDFSGNLQTYANACFAECAGFENVNLYFYCNDDCFCPIYEAPVCVLDDSGDTLTFGNHCLAECEGYGPLDWVDCEPEDGEDNCNCDALPIDPVCIDVNGTILTFDNACAALCAGFSGDDYFSCDENGECICPEFYHPVCVIDDNGDTLTFNNFCLANCAGYSDDQWFECDIDLCSCPVENNPVCVILDELSGLIITFPNACLAECVGYTEEDFLEDCNFDCNCPTIEAPVCVMMADGTLATFTNECQAACFGFTSNDFVDCDTEEDPESCVCDEVWDPVCVLTDQGDTLSFQNACLAECEGYTAANFVECDDCYCEAPDFPTCYIDPLTGEVITVDNICDALCENVPLENLFYCNETEDCQALFDYEVIGDSSLTVNFFDQSIAGAPIDSWLWNFGDGNFSTEPFPTYEYAEAGWYEVILTITAGDCITESSQTIVVGGNEGNIGLHCQAFFFFEQPNPDDLLTYQFVSYSLGNVQSWIWDFGDGNLSFEENPSHTYAESGTYNVSLTIITTDDCESTITIVISAGENIWYGDYECRAWFLPIIDPASNTVYFINLSSFDAELYDWDFGDSGTSNDYEPIYTYTESGTYEVALTITTNDGCENTYMVTLDLDTEGFTSEPQFSMITSTTSTLPVADIDEAIAFPNPTSDLVQIRWLNPPTETYDWQLIDINGRVVKTGQSAQPQLELDLSVNPSGIYLLQMQTDTRVTTLRLVRQ